MIIQHHFCFFATLGLNEEWGSLQGELSCVEKEKGCLEAALQSAVAANKAAQSHSAEQVRERLVQSDGNQN